MALALGLAAPAAGAIGGATLQGRVTSTTGASVASAKVTVFSAFYGTVLATKTADWTGSWTITTLPSGGVKVRFDDPSGTWESRFNGGAATFAAAAPITLADGATTTVDVALPAKGVIAGLVRNTFGTPLQSIPVTVVNATYANDVATTRTDEAGRYSIGGLATGSYKVRVADNSNAAVVWNSNALGFKSAPALAVSAGTTTTADVILPHPGTIAGTTVTATGAPLNGMSVAVSTADVADIVKTKAASSTSNVVGVSLAPGAYKLVAFDPAATATAGYRPTFHGGYIVGDLATGFAGSPPIIVTESATTQLPPIVMVPVHCDPATFFDGANLTGASLAGADLSGCVLTNTNLTGADITNATLLGANLTGANLTGANLTGALAGGAKLTSAVWSSTTCPDGYVTAASGDSCLAHLGASSTFNVNTTADQVDSSIGDDLCWSDIAQGCTLRAAVQENNAHPGHTVVLQGTTYLLSRTGSLEDAGASGDLDVTAHLTIDGNGALIQGWGDRLFQVFAGATVHVDDAVITQGGAPGDGGGISNAGTLTLTNTTVISNLAAGGVTNNATGNGTDARRGGGIFNTGTLTIDHSTVSYNTMGAGGPAVAGTTGPGGISGTGGDGGGIYNTGTLTITASSVQHNTASQGGASFGGSKGTTAGRGGRGGGLYNAGTTTIVDSSIDTNHAGGGGIGLTGSSFGDLPQTAGNGGDGGKGGDGGGIYSTGPLAVRSSTINDNVAGAGGSGGTGGHDFLSPNGGNGGNGGKGGDGGGVYALNTSTFVNATIARNAPGAFGAGGQGGAPGGENGVGTGTYGAPGTNGAPGNVGGLFVVLATSTIDFSTIARNNAAGGSTISNLGVFLGTATISDTIVSDGVNGANCGGSTITSGGYNVDSASSCAFGAVGDQSSTAPVLGALQYNGQVNGLNVLTLLPASGSPALDKIPPGVHGCGTTVATDARGFVRPTGGACDVGAVER